jgi:hypothetical protein
MTKTLDIEIADILQNPSSSKAFIIADAKDADMAFGVAAPGPRRTPKTTSYETDWKTSEDFRAQIRDVIRQRIVDIVLLSGIKRRNPGDGGTPLRELRSHASSPCQRHL